MVTIERHADSKKSHLAPCVRISIPQTSGSAIRRAQERGGAIGTKRVLLAAPAGLFAPVSRTMVSNRNRKISPSMVALLDLAA
jgi:hypothetical protein